MLPPCWAGGRVCSFGFGIISNLTPTGMTGPRGAGAKPTCLGCRPGTGLGHGGLSCLWAARGLGVSPGTHPPGHHGWVLGLVPPAFAIVLSLWRAMLAG